KPADGVRQLHAGAGRARAAADDRHPGGDEILARNRMDFGVAALAVLWLAMLVTGAGPLDRQLLQMLYAADRSAVRDAVIVVTQLGSWSVLLTLATIGAAWLIYRRKVRGALLLLAITLVGLLLIDLQKLGIGRLRPQSEVHRVLVGDLSFPSGHAGNTMIVFMSLALLVAPRRFRNLAVAAALVGTAAVGITR